MKSVCGLVISLVFGVAGVFSAQAARAAGFAATEAGAGLDAAQIAWPYPNDIPVASSAAPGLAGERPYDIVRFLKTRGPTNVMLAPDGRTLAFRSTVTGKPQLFTLDLASGSSPIQITFGRAVTFFAWAPDSQWLLYAADRDGNEREGYTLISRDGARERRLSESAAAFRNFGGFSSDATRIAFASTQRNGTDFDVFVQNVNGAAAREVYRGQFGFFAAGWQPGGTLLLLSETRGEDGNNLYLLETRNGRLEVLFEPEENAEYANFAWLADGSGFYLATNHEREFRALAFYHLADRRLEILETPAHDVGNVTLFGADRYLAWTVNEDGYDRIQVRDRDEGRLLEVPELPAGVVALSGATHAPELALQVSGPTTPGEAWVWRAGAASARQVLSPTLAGIDPAMLTVPEAVRFAARDGVVLHGLLYQPAAAPGAARPALMLKVHGGPSSQARPRFDPVAQYLVGRGYAVFDLNFRGSTGYGKTFARLDNGRLRPNAVRDIEDTVRWLGDNVAIDPLRMAIMGGSYGGYLTNAAVGEYPGLFRAAVSFVGVSDWVRALEEASPGLKASDRIEYGDIDDPDDRAFFATISPIAKADRIRTPMVVVHGANDPRDPVTESDRMVQAVREQEVEVKYLRFADEGHGLRKLGNRITAYREIAAFLDEQLQ